MKFLKFNLIFIPMLGACLGAVGYIGRELLLENARKQVIENARIMLETALSSRTYTTKQVAPLLQQKNFKLQGAFAELQKLLHELPKTIDVDAAKDVRSGARRGGFVFAQRQAIEAQQRVMDSTKDRFQDLFETDFHPQSVPAFAASEIFGYLHEKFPDYSYKEATLNPTNPRNRPTDWETDVVNKFRAESSANNEFTSTRETPSGTSLFLARPIRIDNVSCLECHSTPDKAPSEVVKFYGTANRFGWKMDEVIGAQIISVPMSLALKIADQSFHSLAQWLTGAFVGIGLTGNLAAFVFSRRPR